MRLALFALVMAGCGGAAAPVVERPDGVEPDEAVREARDLIEEAYASLRRGDAEGLLPLLAPDVFILGPGADNQLRAGSDALVAFGDFLDDAKVKTHKLKSRDLQVVASSGGHAAWAVDQLELDGATYAFTAVLTHDDDLWTFRAVHVARTYKPKQLGKLEPQAGAAFAIPAPPDQTGLALIALATEAIGDIDARLEQMPGEDDDAGFDAVVISTAPRGATHGVGKIGKAWKKRFEPPKRKKQRKGWSPPPLPEAIGELLVDRTADDTVAWVCANVDTEGTPHRMFLLYARLDDTWRLMSIQDAALTRPLEE